MKRPLPPMTAKLHGLNINLNDQSPKSHTKVPETFELNMTQRTQ